jgi:hypothetical protein
MPVGVTLANLRRDLRAETGQSLNMAQGVQSQATQDNQLDRQQLELWDAYDWPHLAYWVDVPAAQSQSLYSYPQSMPFNQINRIYWQAANATKWRELAYGIRAFDPLPGTPQTGTPARWGNIASVDTNGVTNPVGQLEILPKPSSNGTLRFEGSAPCNPLVADTDICVLDSKLIVLFAAAEILATQKVEAAQLKLLKAQTYLRRLRSSQGADKRANYNMGGNYRTSGRGHYGVPWGAVPGIGYVPD